MNDKMNAQMSRKGGFIAALDQSGGSTPGALRLYGVPDSGLLSDSRLFATHAVGRTWLSGGLTGPEGSLLFLPVALLGAGIVLLTLPRTHCGYIAAGAPQTSGEVRSQNRPPVLP